MKSGLIRTFDGVVVASQVRMLGEDEVSADGIELVSDNSDELGVIADKSRLIRRGIVSEDGGGLASGSRGTRCSRIQGKDTAKDGNQIKRN